MKKGRFRMEAGYSFTEECPSTSKGRRWFATLIIVALNPLSAALIFPMLAIGLAVIASEQGKGMRSKARRRKQPIGGEQDEIPGDTVMAGHERWKVLSALFVH